ncbi:MAG: Na+/H+ antiporter NhaC family protein [Deltaproteobacteria bacterium]|nr:Na+/H+ antiporter NhaC family protein [Deltaproteobacteria bacterium]
MERSKKGGFKSLIPFIVFLAFYFGIGLHLTLKGEEFAFYKFPAPSCALIGFAVALAIGWRDLHGHVSIFAKGVGEETVIIMCLIFMLAGAFASVTKAMGGVDSTVNMGLSFLPGRLILPGVFIISCFVSLAMGTSMGTIGAVAPIAIGLSLKAGVPMPIMMGAVLGGAMFGDNLSIISDTTIAATGSQGCEMRSKMLMNLKIAIPAAIVVLILLFVFSKPVVTESIYDYSVVKTFPYIIVFALALMGLNVIAVLMIGIFFATLIGVASGAMSFVEFGKVSYDGFISMAEVFFVAVLVAGLAALATEHGGLDYILRKFQKLLRGKRSAEFGIGGLVSIADIFTANNTVAIVIVGKMAKKIAGKFDISAKRSASILDVFSCVWQGVIPYGAQLLLIGGLAKLSPFTIIPYAWYPFTLAVFAVFAIVFKYPKG